MYTEEDIIQECNRKDLSFKRIEYVYINNRKRKCVIYTCDKHNNYGEQLKPVEKIFSTKQPCVYCNHSRLDLTLQDEVSKINPQVKIIGKYINTDTHVECQCMIHNETWSTRPLELLKGKVGCSQCIAIKKHNKRVKSLDVFKQEVKNVNPNIEFIGEYENTYTLTKFKCIIHNIEFESLPCNILNKTATCPICSKRNIQIKEGLSINDLKQVIKKNNMPIEVIDEEYINNRTPIKCRCLIHDIEYKTPSKNFLYRDSSGCPKCHQSIGEHKLHDILIHLGFNVKSQYSFDDCKYKNRLRFDYYDEKNKVAFEYQGQQHYYPINFGGISDKEAQREFETNIKRDSIKKEYCNTNNIKLICIPYWEYDNMEQFLLKNI